MFSIAIVDDEILDCAKIDEYLKRFFHFTNLVTNDFSNGKELINSP